MKTFRSYKDEYNKDRKIEFCYNDSGSLSILDDSRRDEGNKFAQWGVINKKQVKALIRFLEDAVSVNQDAVDSVQKEKKE